LRRHPQHGLGKDLATLAERCVPIDHDVVMKTAPIAEDYIRSHDAIGSELNATP
jgi:hypothetical protein